jgi:hypothetical protein
MNPESSLAGERRSARRPAAELRVAARLPVEDSWSVLAEAIWIDRGSRIASGTQHGRRSGASDAAAVWVDRGSLVAGGTQHGRRGGAFEALAARIGRRAFIAGRRQGGRDPVGEEGAECLGGGMQDAGRRGRECNGPRAGRGWVRPEAGRGDEEGDGEGGNRATQRMRHGELPSSGEPPRGPHGRAGAS